MVSCTVLFRMCTNHSSALCIGLVYSLHPFVRILRLLRLLQYQCACAKVALVLVTSPPKFKTTEAKEKQSIRAREYRQTA